MEPTDGVWRVKPRKDNGWLAGVGKLPTPLRGDRDGRPDVGWWLVPDTRRLRDELEEAALRRGEHAVQEERRLAYVALTRARRRMLLTAPVWSTGKNPRVTSRFLEEVRELPGVPALAWEPMPDPDDPAALENPLAGALATAPWPRPGRPCLLYTSPSPRD